MELYSWIRLKHVAVMQFILVQNVHDLFIDYFFLGLVWVLMIFNIYLTFKSIFRKALNLF